MRRLTVVFDLDGTLVAGDSFGGFLRHLLARQPLRYLAALVTLPVWLPVLLLPPARVQAERYLVWVAAVGMDDLAFREAAEEFAAAHAGPAAGRAAAAALQRVREHQDRGDRVIVATACATPLAEEICAVLGLEGVEVVASRLVRQRWGLPATTVPARGKGKLVALEAAGVRFPLDHAYSDSLSDLPLLQSARVAHVVDPKPNELPRLRRALGADVDVIRWARPAPEAHTPPAQP